MDLHKLYLFKNNYLPLNGLKYHYLDEGCGEPVLMVHGNPSWSYYYRNLVIALRENYRCIVPDHIGCGLSDKPADRDYKYTLESRIDDLEALLESLAIKENITLVVHDWGGMIGMGYATRHPERIKRLVILNTSAFHIPETKKFPLALWICRNTLLGAFLVRRFNAFSAIASLIGVKRKGMPRAVRRAYVAPFNSWKNRISTLRFVQDIPLFKGDRNYQLVSDIDKNLQNFQKVPTLVCWGLKDFVFDNHFLNLWKEKMPHAVIHEFNDCGHYILEDASEQVIPLVQSFMSCNSQYNPR